MQELKSLRTCTLLLRSMTQEPDETRLVAQIITKALYKIRLPKKDKEEAEDTCPFTKYFMQWGTILTCKDV